MRLSSSNDDPAAGEPGEGLGGAAGGATAEDWANAAPHQITSADNTGRGLKFSEYAEFIECHGTTTRGVLSSVCAGAKTHCVLSGGHDAEKRTGSLEHQALFRPYQFLLVLLLLLNAAGCVSEHLKTTAERETIRASAEQRVVAPSPLRRYEYGAVRMGVAARIVIYGSDETAAAAAAREAFAEIERLEQQASDYRPMSDLNGLSDAAGGATRVIPRELWNLLLEARELARRSGGAFDPTVGRVTRSWRRARAVGAWPSEDERSKARATVDWRTLELQIDVPTARLSRPGTRLDLGGIAKGWAAQAARDRLSAMGFAHVLVALAGDIAVGAAPPDEAAGWRIGVSGTDPEDSRVLRCVDQVISTSGDAVQFVEIEGRREAHIIDPRTGRGIAQPVRVTTVARRGTTADGLATALAVLIGQGDRAAAERLVREYVGAAAVINPESETPGVIDPGGVLRWDDEKGGPGVRP